MKTSLPLPDFKALFESAPDLYLILLPDAHFTIIGASNAYLQATMTERDKIVGRGLFDVFPDNPDDLNATGVKNLSTSLGRVLQHGVPDTMAIQKYDVRRPEGDKEQFEERYWSPVNSPVFGPDKKIVYIIHRVEDVTESVRLKQRGIKQEEHYRILFDSIDEGFCIIEMIFDEKENPIDYRFLEINPSFEKQTGLKNAQGKRMLELAPLHERHWFDIYGKIALTGESVRFENRAEQLHRWYEVYAFRFGEPKNRQVAILFNDITERKKSQEDFNRQRAAALNLMLDAREAEQNLSKVNKKLDQSNKDLEQFAYITSHDLKAPLRGIGSLADWLYKDYADKLDDEGRENLELMKGRVTRMSGLIDGILRYCRIGKDHADKEKTDLNILVNEVVDLLDAPKNIQISVGPEFPKVNTVQVQLAQVFQNLITNAIRCLGKNPGSIRVNCQDRDNEWLFSVEDTGPGIPKEHFERIFQVFQTLASRDEVESTGIGLSIVKKVVELHGGKVWLESELKKGTTFYFTLPKS